MAASSQSLYLQTSFHPGATTPGVNPANAGGRGTLQLSAVPGVPLRPSPVSMADGGGGGACCTALPGFNCSVYVKTPGLSTGFDPSDKIAIGDITRWYNGDGGKVYTNIVKMQGAMEALGAAGVSGYASLTKSVGQAHAVVSRVDASGQQGVQSYLHAPYNKAVPNTGAVSVAPLAVTGFRSAW
jgi:hypothetical protein